MEFFALVSAIVLGAIVIASVALLPGWSWSRTWSYRPFALAAASLPFIELGLLIGVR